jgi:hypothetical protein
VARVCLLGNGADERSLFALTDTRTPNQLKIAEKREREREERKRERKRERKKERKKERKLLLWIVDYPLNKSGARKVIKNVQKMDMCNLRVRFKFAQMPNQTVSKTLL